MQKYFFLLMLTLPGGKVFGQTNVTDSLALNSIEAKWETMIDEVTVVAHRPVVKFTTDKVNFRVKDDPDSKTQTVLEPPSTAMPSSFCNSCTSPTLRPTSPRVHHGRWASASPPSSR